MDARHSESQDLPGSANKLGGGDHGLHSQPHQHHDRGANGPQQRLRDMWRIHHIGDRFEIVYGEQYAGPMAGATLCVDYISSAELICNLLNTHRVEPTVTPAWYLEG